jgi:hypothetical protein
MLDRLRRNLPEILGFLALSGIMSLTYRALISTDTILSFDDDVLVYPLLDQDSITTYFKNLRAHQFLDIQPVRDLLYMLDIWLIKVLPFWSYHLSNLLIWLAVCGIYMKILGRVVESRASRNLIIFLIAIHPAMALSLSWISAKKHLLAALFTGLATWVLMQPPRNTKARRIFQVAGWTVFYALAVFSQPIAILWPFWAALYLWTEGDASGEKGQNKWRNKWRILPLLLPAFAVLAICFKLNWDYYSGIYVVHTGARKVSHQFNLPFAVLGIGRYVYNVVFPSTISVAYDYGAIQNVLGLIFLPLSLWVFIKTMPVRKLLLWGAYAVFPIAVVLERQSNIFVSDTYLAIPMLGIAVLFGESTVGIIRKIHAHPAKIRKAVSALFLVWVAFSVYQSKGISRGFMSDLELWEWASGVEKTPFTLSQQVIMEGRHGNDRKALYLAQFFYNWNPQHLLAARTLANAVFAYREWSDQEKIKFLEERMNPDPWFNYFLAGLYMKQEKFEKAWEHARNLHLGAMDFEGSAESISAEVSFLCRRAKGADCENIEKNFMKSTENRVQPWRHAVFEGRLKAMMPSF